MSWLGMLSVMLCCSTLVLCDSEADEQMNAEYVERFRQGFKAANITANTFPSSESNSQTVGVDFECELPQLNPPTSIHNLSPMYVDVIAALGDSVTAAQGAGASIITDTRDFRGLSWSIGGDKTLTDVLTLPNVLRGFNPDLQGYSTGIGTENPQLNVAIGGARTRHMLEQAENLVKKMEEKGITDDDWKVITMWIGGNDICDIRNDGVPPETIATQYTEKVKEALDYLRTNVKRAFVNMVLMIDIAELSEVKGLICGIVHEFACNSIQKEETRLKASETSQLYNVYLEQLIDGGKEYDRDDFTVVLQPFFSDTKVPRKSDGSADKSYFAPDCFHFSQKGHGVGATYLWNNMFEAVGDKTSVIDWDNQAPFTCPVDFPYFSTYLNRRAKGGLLNANSNEQGSPHHTSLVAVLMGTGVGVVVVALAMIAVATGIVRHRRLRKRGCGQHRGPPSEKMYLLYDFKG